MFQTTLWSIVDKWCGWPKSLRKISVALKIFKKLPNVQDKQNSKMAAQGTATVVCCSGQTPGDHGFQDQKALIGYAHKHYRNPLR